MELGNHPVQKQGVGTSQFIPEEWGALMAVHRVRRNRPDKSIRVHAEGVSDRPVCQILPESRVPLAGIHQQWSLTV